MLRNKLMTACSVALLTAALYGCSSSSDDGANMKVQDLEDQIAALSAELGEGQELTPETLAALVSDLATADGRVTELETMIGDETDPAAESLRGMLAQANVDLGEARTALEMAMDNSADEMVIAGLRQDVTAAEGMRDNYKAMLDTANDNLATVTTERDDARTELAEFKKTAAAALATVDLKERIAREKAIRAAILTDNNRVGTDTKAVPNTLSGVVAVPGVVAKRNAAGMVTVDMNGAADDVYTGGATTAGSGSWNSVTMTRSDAVSGATDTLVIYTDIDAPKDTLLTTVYLVDGANLLDAALAHGNDMTDARYGKAQSDGFPSGPGVTWTYGPAGRATAVIGTFDGVVGQFMCITTPCTVATNAMGKLLTSVNWRFTADAQNSATVKVPDAGYAYFGWWLNKPKLNTGTHDVEVFAGGTNPATLTAGIVGDASYSGPAAGKYVTKTFSAGPQTDAGVGHFTANANLKASFGTATDTAVGTIGGMIDGFVLDDGATPGWAVKLETVNLTADPTFSGTTEVNFGGGLTDSDANQVGNWQGSFYDTAPATPAGGAPGAVAGTFDATTDNATVIGGFGATKQ